MMPLSQEVLSLCALALTLTAAAVALFAQPVCLVGDASEYGVMLVAWSRHWTPGITTHDVAAYNSILADRPVESPGPVTPGRDPFMRVRGVEPPVWDMRHFWIYSMMAWPFLAVARVCGFHPFSAFTLLHVTLMLGVIVLARRWSGPRGALAAAIVLVCSPAFWYTNKVYTEFLTIATALAGFVGLASGQAAWGALIDAPARRGFGRVHGARAALLPGPSQPRESTGDAWLHPAVAGQLEEDSYALARSGPGASHALAAGLALPGGNGSLGHAPALSYQCRGADCGCVPLFHATRDEHASELELRGLSFDPAVFGLVCPTGVVSTAPLARVHLGFDLAI